MNYETAKFIGKGGDRNTLINTIKQVKQQYGDSVSLHGAFIFGLPKESVESMKKTAEQLNSGKTGLDSWYAGHLRLMSPDGVAYSSDLDRNYAKYGYTVDDGIDPLTHSYIWKNELTNYYQCKDLAEGLHAESVASGIQKMFGIEAFYVAGMGVDLQDILNKPFAKVDWHGIEQLKEKHFNKYLSMLYNHVGITQ